VIRRETRLRQRLALGLVLVAASVSPVMRSVAWAGSASGTASVEIQDSGGFRMMSVLAGPTIPSSDGGGRDGGGRDRDSSVTPAAGRLMTSNACTGLMGFSVINPSGTPDAVTVPQAASNGGATVDELSVVRTGGGDASGATPYCMSGQLQAADPAPDLTTSSSTGASKSITSGLVVVPVDVNYN
jgi:hypothetical protein